MFQRIRKLVFWGHLVAGVAAGLFILMMATTGLLLSFERQLTDPCPYCSGSGSIKSASTICYEILTEMKKIGADLEGQGVILRVNPDIARALKEEESALLRDLQQTLGKPVTVKADTHLHHEQFDVMAI